MGDVEIGIGKAARRGFGLDEVTIVPSRRTRDDDDVDVSWQLDAFRLDLPIVAGPADAVVSPMSAIALARLGGLAALDLEGLWTRYEDPTPLFEEIAALEASAVTERLQKIYAAPVRPDLITERLREIGASGVVTCGALTPQRAVELAPSALAAEVDVLLVRGTVVSAEHVSKGAEPLHLGRFIREIDLPVLVGGCASYQAALHLMRTGAVGVLVGVGEGEGCSTSEVLGIGVPQATAVADAAGARSRHLEETGVYVHVIADGGVSRAGELAVAIACGADAVTLGAPLAAAAEAPGLGVYWGASAAHPSLPRGGRLATPACGTFSEVLLGPASDDSGRLNLIGALRKTMANCGYANMREFHKAEVVVSSPQRRAPLVR